MDLKDLLTKQKLDPAHVMVMRHAPREPKFRSALPRVAEQKPGVFNAYQQCQEAKVGRGMMKAQLIASFIGMEPKTAVFVGLYRRGACRPITDEQFWSAKGAADLRELGVEDFVKGKPYVWIDLELLDFYSMWKGRLEVGWPPPERKWYRIAKASNSFPVRAIHDTSLFDEELPPWYEVDFTCADIKHLSRSWREQLQRWRGVYFVFDVKKCQGYVGYALSILDRWRDHVARRGDAVKLKQCDPSNFRFTILELASPNADEDELSRIEITWKNRLHTRECGLNDN